jgi:AcrR family transcriptional regulator
MTFSGVGRPDVATGAPEPVVRLVDAARAIASESGTASFTVDQVVTRSGLSLKAFYRHFASKDELLLALLEEESQVGAVILADMMEGEADPLERLRVYVAGLFSMVRFGAQYAQLLGREHLRLEGSHPAEVHRAVAPFLDLLTGEIAAAMDGDVVRPGDARRDAVVVLSLVLARIHALALGELDDRPEATSEHLWEFCRAALTARPTSS